MPRDDCPWEIQTISHFISYICKLISPVIRHIPQNQRHKKDGQVNEEQVLLFSMPQTKDSKQTASLVEKAKSGNRFAFEQLADSFHQGIFRMVYYRTHSTMDAEDLTQDIFLQAFKNLSRLKEPHKFKSWLFSIALNKVRDFHRKKRFQNLFGSFSEKENEGQPGSEQDGVPEAMNNLIRHDFWRNVNILLDKLPRMEREVFALRFMDHLSIKEISAVLKKGESTVKTHLYRAIGKFREDPFMLELSKEYTA